MDTNKSPYHNRYSPNSDNVQILGKALVPELYASEVNEVQSLILEYIKRFANTQFKEGSVIYGVTSSVSDNVVHMSDGLVFIDRLPRFVKGESIMIRGIGEETIGIRLTEKLITAREDKSLLDPAPTINKGKEGMDRVQHKVEFTLNDPNAIPLYTFKDGVLYKEEVITENLFDTTLARRTYDESGNYKVYGLRIHDAESTTAPTISIGYGKAYVRGYEVTKPVDTVLELEPSIITRRVLGEPKGYVSSVSKYYLSSTPVASVISIRSSITRTDNVIRGGVLGGFDYLPYSPVSAVTSITYGESTYNQGTDYQLIDDGIDWSLGGSEPPTGVSYSVTYTYNKTMREGEDFKHTNNYIEFTNNSPDEFSTFHVDYEYYMYRVDNILMNRHGQFSVQQGISNTRSLAVPRINRDEDYLLIGSVLIEPGESTKVYIDNNNLYNTTMSGIRDLEKRQSEIEFNSAMDKLESEAMGMDSGSSLRGVLTDNFTGHNKSDIVYNDGVLKYGASIDIDKELVTLPQSIINTDILIGENDDLHVWGVEGYTTLAFTEEVAIQQEVKTTTTDTTPIPELTDEPPFTGVVKLSPAVDHWVDDQVMIVTDFDRAQFEDRPPIEPYGTLIKRLGRKAGREEWKARAALEKKLNQLAELKTETKREVVFEGAVEFMRQIDISVSLTGFPSNSTGYIISFNGIPVTGEVTVNSLGAVNQMITIPPKVPCGSVEVEVSNGTYSAVAMFRSEGVLRRIEEREIVLNPVKLPSSNVVIAVTNLMGRLSNYNGGSFTITDRDTGQHIETFSMTNGRYETHLPIGHYRVESNQPVMPAFYRQAGSRSFRIKANTTKETVLLTYVPLDYQYR